MRSAMAPENPIEPAADLAERIARGLPELARFVRRRLGPELRSKESASDIVQSTARELLGSGRFEDLGEEGFQRWLRVAAEHKIRNRARYWRSAGRERAEAAPLSEDECEDADDLRPSHEAMLHEEGARLARAVAALDPDYRQVLRRVQFDGASYQEVAGELGRSPEAVRKLLARALARLSSSLGDGSPSP